MIKRFSQFTFVALAALFLSGCIPLQNPAQSPTPASNATEKLTSPGEKPTFIDPSINTNGAGEYVTYTPENFAAAEGKRRVLFFHAPWCPTCKVLNQELLDDVEQLPADVVIFKTDYDTESDLKKQYGITYQHTLVQVDENGNTIKKWNGGGVQEILNNLQGAQ